MNMAIQSGACRTLRCLDWYLPHRHRLEGMSANCVHFSSLKSKHSTLRIAFGACPPMTSKTYCNIMRHFDIVFQFQFTKFITPPEWTKCRLNFSNGNH